jgi:predicted ATPase
MQPRRILIQNYKSLRNVDVIPKPFSVFVGRNASGKSNFADALDFIAIAYSDGLEHAVARKGGYENIAHRKERRSKSAITFRLELEAEVDDLEPFEIRHATRARQTREPRVIRFHHQFSFRAAGGGIKSDFKIVDETFELIQTRQENQGGVAYEWVKIHRQSDGSLIVEGDHNSELAKSVLYIPERWTEETSPEFHLSPTELLLAFPFIRPRLTRAFRSWLSRLCTFQVSPDASRRSGAPTPNPTLSVRGDNLPAVVNWLKAKQPKEWRQILQAMKDIVPELEDISIIYLHTRTLGLSFKENGVGRPWSTEEVSDGTIRSLAMLVACFDPRVSGLVLEEPENSLHPWIIKEIVKHLRNLSDSKFVMVTTHSPVVLNSVRPNDVWIVYKRNGETHIRPLIELDPNVEGDWEKGKYRLFDFLESGAILEAVP